MADINIIGTKFLEIEAKRDVDFSGKINLKSNIQIPSIDKVEKAKDTLKIIYIFEINYGDLGKVKIKGEIYIKSDQKTIKTILNNKDKKNYNTPEYLTITNFIIQKASIKAFELEEEINLPIHIKLPKLSSKK